jgi:hypothetical protein
MMNETYRTSISLKEGGIISKNGTKDEVELFIIENMDNANRWRTCNKNTGNIETELCGTN